jgi:uroporphyrinogen-III synthase
MSVKGNPIRKKVVKKGNVAAKTAKTNTAVVKKNGKEAPSSFKNSVKKIVNSVIKKAGKVLPSALTEKKVVSIEEKETIEKAQSVKRVRKTSKKQTINLPAPPPIEVSNHPRTRVKNILVSQPKPVETEKNPYFDLAKKYHLGLTFRQFIKVEGLTAQEFRAQRIDILEHGAVILTSKLAVDHYFRICNEMRITVPETMKYFCINEQTAYYLQKYIQYRKRKIFFGHGTILDLVDVIRKNKAEKFLLPSSDVQKEQIVEFLDEVKITFTRATFYKTVSADLSDIKSLADYDILVFFTPVGIKSLRQNFPNFKQGNTRIAAFGHVTAQMVKTLGYRLDIFAPNPQNPSMTGALDAYIREANKK